MFCSKQILELNADLRRHLAETDAFEWFSRCQGTVYREAANRRTTRIQVGGKAYFVKFQRGCGWREIFKNLFRGTVPVLSAETEWEAIARLDALQIRTMTVAGKGLRGANPAKLQSFIVTEALENTVSLERLTQTWGEWKTCRRVQLKHALLESVATIARKLHTAGLNHRDFYLCHLLVNDRAWDEWSKSVPIDLFLIDLHRVQIRKRVPERWIVKDLAGMLFSALDIGITWRDMLRFARAYRREPLRDVLKREGAFWRKVIRRAEKLYNKVHQRPAPHWLGRTVHRQDWVARSPVAACRRDSGQDLWRAQWEFESQCNRELLGKVIQADQESIKAVPGRKVNRCEVDGRVFYLKEYSYSFFSGLRCRFKVHRSRREWETASLLRGIGLNIVPHLAHGELWGRFGLKRSWLLTEGPSGLVPLLEGGAASDMKIQQGLGCLVRELHGANLFHGDLSVDNLLYSSSTHELRLLDLDNIELCGNLDLTRRTANLASLHRRIPLGQEFYRSYGEADIDPSRVEQLSKEIRTRAVAKRFKMGIREGRSYGFRKIAGISWYVRFASCGSHLDEILASPDERLIKSERIFKDGRSSLVASVNGFVIKRYNLRKLRNLVLDQFRSSRAMSAFRKARHLELLDIPTARPVAVADRRYGGLKFCSYLITEEIPGAVSIDHWRGDEYLVALRLAEVIARIHSEGFRHRDLKGSNLLLDKNGHPFLIDLDGLVYSGRVSDRVAMNNLARLAGDLSKRMPNPALKFRAFLRCYCACRQVGNWRSWWKEIRSRVNERHLTPVPRPGGGLARKRSLPARVNEWLSSAASKK